MTSRKNDQKSRLSWFFDIALLLAFITVVINISVMSWQAGYLRYFKIPISDIDFVPKIFDFATIGLVAVVMIAILSGIAILIFVGAKLLTGYLQKRASKSRKRWYRVLFGGDELLFTRGSVFLMGAIFVVGATYQIAYVYFDNRGYEMAKVAIDFSVIEEGDDYAKVVVYQNNNVGVVKRYSMNEDVFDDGFEIVDLVGRHLTYTEIIHSE
ncbi:MAG: hypothetical protein ACK5MU_04465 [Candidatus Saccharimonadales bacterium]